MSREGVVMPTLSHSFTPRNPIPSHPEDPMFGPIQHHGFEECGLEHPDFLGAIEARRARQILRRDLEDQDRDIVRPSGTFPHLGWPIFDPTDTDDVERTVPRPVLTRELTDLKAARRTV